MTDNGAPPAEPARPRIVIEFGGPDLATCAIRPEGPLTVAQIYGAAWLFDTWARETRTRELMTAGAGLATEPDAVAGILRQFGIGGPPGVR